MSLFALLLAMLPASASLEPVRNTDLAAALSYQEELASTVGNREASFNVRVYRVPTEIGECGGPITSCPDVDLYVSASYGDLGEIPSLFRLPRAKGWEFVRWQETCPSSSDEAKIGLLVRTVLPGANIDPDERARWLPTEYEVCVGLQSGSFSTKRHIDGS